MYCGSGKEAHGVVALNVRRLARGVDSAAFAEADLGVGKHRSELLEDAHPIRLEAVAVVLVVADQDVVEPLSSGTCAWVQVNISLAGFAQQSWL